MIGRLNKNVWVLIKNKSEKLWITLILYILRMNSKLNRQIKPKKSGPAPKAEEQSLKSEANKIVFVQ